MLDSDYPEAAIISEWSNPVQSLKNGFHADFYLDHHGNGYNTLLRDYETPGGDHSFLKKDGNGDIMRFLNDFLPKYDSTKDDGYISFITCNHDTPRPRRTLEFQELKLSTALFLTLPGVPFIYYGDEIGMRYLDLPTKEGGYTRTGSRTPMQWNHGKNLGFSDADSKDIYLPVDPSPDAPTVTSQENDPDSLLSTTKALTKIRHEYPDLHADSSFEVVYAEAEEFPFVFKRGNLYVAINPSEKKAGVSVSAKREKIFEIGKTEIKENSLIMEPQSFVILK